MMRKKTTLTVFLICSLGLLYSLGQAEKDLPESRSHMAVLGEDGDTVTFREYDGREVVLPKNPQRTVVCLNSLLDLWYMAGGEAVARVRGTVNVPDEARDIVDLGSFSRVNMETIMELEPDFIIFSHTQRDKRDFFEAEGVPAVSINYKNYDDFRVVLDLFSRLTGNREFYETDLVGIQRQVQAVIDQVPEGEGPRFCILFATTNYVKVETQNSLTGHNLMLLGGRNIYTDDTVEEAERVDLSLEYILEQDPDVIFTTTMGDEEKCLEQIRRDVESSDIWGELSAVKEGRFYVLDKEYSVYKPNRSYPETFALEAELLYPDTVFTVPSLKGDS